LEDYFDLTAERPALEFNCSTLWRCYVGTWEIRQDRLYLIGIDARRQDGSNLTLDHLFPGYPKRVFAHWYYGTLRVPQGNKLEYVHMGYASMYESDLLIGVEAGVVVKTEVRHNALPEEKAPSQ
jgi:hypothetical protein